MIRADLDPRSRPDRRPRRGRSRAVVGRPEHKPDIRESPGNASLSAAGGRFRPGRGRAEGQAGDPLFVAGAGLALLDAVLRRDPPAAGALRARLALQSAAASAKILRLNADEGALRDLRFAVGDEPARGEAASAVARPRRPAAQPRPRPACRRGGAARPGLPDPNGLAPA